MAKKAVATLQTGNSGRAHSKCIKMVKDRCLHLPGGDRSEREGERVLQVMEL